MDLSFFFAHSTILHNHIFSSVSKQQSTMMQFRYKLCFMTAFMFYAVLFTTRTSSAIPIEDVDTNENPNEFRRDVSKAALLFDAVNVLLTI